MSGKSPIFYNALLLTGVNLLLRLVSTSFQVYLSGQIGAAGVGLLQLVLSVGGMAMTAATAGIRTTAMYLTAEELGRNHREHICHILSGCVTYSMICSGCIGLLLYIFAPMIASSWIGSSQTVAAIRLLACMLPVSCLCGVMTGYFTAAGRIRALSVTEIAEQLCSMGATMLALTLWAGDDPGKACQSVVLGSGVGACVTLIILSILRLQEHAPKAPPFPLAKRLVSTAFPLALADDLKACISTTENLIVPKRLALFSGAADPLAVFGTVCAMVFPVLMFPAAIVFSLAELLIPEMARCAAAGSQKRIVYLAKKSLRIVLLYSCLTGALLHIFAKPLCMRLYRSSDAGSYLSLYAFLAPMLYCDAIIDAMNKGLGQQKICVRYNVLTAALDVLFLYILLPKYGMQGYFFSFLITHLLNFILSLRLLLRTARLTVRLKTPAMIALATCLCLLLCQSLPHAFARAGAFVLLFFSLLTLMGIVSRQDLHWLKGLAGK